MLHAAPESRLGFTFESLPFPFPIAPSFESWVVDPILPMALDRVKGDPNLGGWCFILNSDVDGRVPDTGGRTAGEISVIFIGLLVFVN